MGVNRLAQVYSVKALSDSCISTAASLQTAFYTIAEWHRIPGVTILATEQHGATAQHAQGGESASFGDLVRWWEHIWIRYLASGLNP